MSVGLLVSFTASAGQTPAGDGQPATSIPRAAPGFFSELEEGPSLLVAASAFRLPGLSLSSSIRPAHLSFDDPEQRIVIDPRQPREDLKRSARNFPEVDRTAKSDPLPLLRPGLSARQGDELERVVFGDNQPGLISAGFSPVIAGAARGDGPPVGFEPFANEEGTTDPAASDSSPISLKQAITSARQAELHLESIDGSTPIVPKTLVSASSTPAIAGSSTTLPTQAPHAPAPAPLSASLGATGQLGKAVSLPASLYTGLITAENMAKEQRCLAEAVYFEARSESLLGQAAVAQVVLNRVKSGLYPDSVCGVVYQNASRYLACQFTFACEGKSLRVTEPAPWRDAVRIAREVYEGKTYLPDVGNSTHYHAQYVRPYWAKKLQKMDTIGQHVFYKLRPGQT